APSRPCALEIMSCSSPSSHWKKSSSRYLCLSEQMQNRMKPHICGNGAQEKIDLFLEPIELMMKEGQYEMAYRLLKVLRQWQERQWIEERLNSIYRKWIRRWHFEMLNDANRGQAFVDALKSLDLRDKTV